MSERGAGSVLTVAAMALVAFVGLAVLGRPRSSCPRPSHCRRRCRALAAAPMTFPPVAGALAGAEALSLAAANGARLACPALAQVATFDPAGRGDRSGPGRPPDAGRRWVSTSSAAEFVP